MSKAKKAEDEDGGALRKVYDAGVIAIRNIVDLHLNGPIGEAREHLDAVAAVWLAENFQAGEMEAVCALSPDLRKACFAELLETAFVEGMALGHGITMHLPVRLKKQTRRRP